MSARCTFLGAVAIGALAVGAARATGVGGAAGAAWPAGAGLTFTLVFHLSLLLSPDDPAGWELLDRRSAFLNGTATTFEAMSGRFRTCA